MTDQFSRSRLIYGDAGVESLQNARVAVFGLGGVGGQVCEALVRTGLGSIDIIDHDVVDLTNLNRQIIATQNTVGMRKIDAMEKRLASINPQCKIQKHDCFFLPETAPQFDFSCYDYIVDAIDTVTAKLELIMCAKKAGVPIISAMGAGNKTDPTALRIADISETSVCRLARIMRKELRKRGIEHVKVCYSTEPSITPDERQENQEQVAEDQPACADSHSTLNADNAAPHAGSTTPHKGRRSTPGSNAFVPCAMGLALAAEVVRSLTDKATSTN